MYYYIYDIIDIFIILKKKGILFQPLFPRSYPLFNMPLPGNVPAQHRERLTDYRVPSGESAETPTPQASKNRRPSDLLKPPWVNAISYFNVLNSIF